SINDCGDSSFDNKSSGGSPRVDDCLQIARNIAGGGTWTVALIGHHQLVEFGTCAFGVQAPFELGVSNIRVGNQDIIDVINDSVRRFQWNGLVGARGEMQCQTDPGTRWLKTEWGIYHT
ncbi:Ecp2 effector protein, partial [Panaeolus papilionaceus]